MNDFFCLYGFPIVLLLFMKYKPKMHRQKGLTQVYSFILFVFLSHQPKSYKF